MLEDKNDEDVEGKTSGTNQSGNEMIDRNEEDKWSAAERGVPREVRRERAGAWKEA